MSRLTEALRVGKITMEGLKAQPRERDLRAKEIARQVASILKRRGGALSTDELARMLDVPRNDLRSALRYAGRRHGVVQRHGKWELRYRGGL